jgi:RNA polymerase sigma-70 factor (ECF subfamily)
MPFPIGCAMKIEVEIDDVKNEDNPCIAHMDRLFSYARVLTRNNSEAEDLVQETYLRAIAGMARLRPDSNTKNWLLTIMRNIWLNQLRKKQTSPEVVYIDACQSNENLAIEPSKGPFELYEKKVESEQIRNAIMQLPLDLREIILLREYEGLPYQEIADILGCPVGTVMSRLNRARAKLRNLISKDSDPRFLRNLG